MNKLSLQEVLLLSVKVNKKLSLVQIARALAILFVLLGHANTLFYNHFKYQWFNVSEWGRTGGVDFFFVVSGFMIYYLYSKRIGKRDKAKEFLLKRVLRIYPLYWIFTAAALFMFIIFPQLGDGHEKNPLVILKSIFLLPVDPILVVTWSLSHVVLFYLVFTFAIVKPNITKPLVGVWILFSLLVSFKVPGFSEFHYFLFSFNNIEILCGCLIAYLILNFKMKYPILITLTGFLLVISVWINNIYNGLNDITIYLYCLSSMLIMLGISSIDLQKETKTPKLFQFLGDASYSIYISHGPLLQFYILVLTKLHTIEKLGVPFCMLIAIALAFLSGCLVYIIVEKPISVLLKNKFLNKKVKSTESVVLTK